MAQSMKQSSFAKKSRSARWLLAGFLITSTAQLAYAGPQDRIASMKKQPMAEAAEQLLAGTGWLPPLMRTAPVAEASGGSVEDIGATEASEGFPEAAE